MTGKRSKKEIETIRKRSARTPSLVWDVLTKDDKAQALKLSESYKRFLDRAKTEREAVACIREQALTKGFQPLDAKKEESAASGRYFKTFRDKVIALAVIGDQPLSDGVNLIASHVDSPRLDLKQNPLYEEVDLALFKTHYYGGIRKYQWLARPLALHGRVITQTGDKLDIVIGESEDDPVFTVSDLLPHLAAKLQGDKKISEGFEGEKLNLLAGSFPIGAGDIKDRFKMTVLDYLFETYGMIEEDFVSAEIEAVPAGKARDVGLDRSLIGAYGQDDRICAYTGLQALLANLDAKPKRTMVVYFSDKEEVGSQGSTGAHSVFIQDFIASLLKHNGEKDGSANLRQTFMNSMILSADVTAAVDPNYPNVHERQNAVLFNHGVGISKYTGSGGKYSCNDANAEFTAKVIRIFGAAGVFWQMGALGKVDEGGGGTIAYILANLGAEVIDCGTGLMGMHSLYELCSKADLYSTFAAYKAFLTTK